MKNILRKTNIFQSFLNFIFGQKSETKPQIKVVGNIALITEASKNFNLKKLGGVK